METIYHDTEGRALYVFDAQGNLQVLRAVQPGLAAAEPNKLTRVPKTKVAGKRGPHATEKSLADEADRIHGRSKIAPEVKEEIERRLIAGDTVASILQKVEVSAPTIYVIKARLKSEGRIV